MNVLETGIMYKLEILQEQLDLQLQEFGKAIARYQKRVAPK